MAARSLLLLCSAGYSLAGIPPPTVPTTDPPFAIRWDMKGSSIAMPCNYTGYTDARATDGYNLISYDWSNAKALWANSAPMDAELRMVEQAAITKGRNADAHVWVYRNLVKALPWLGSVREKLVDPAYSGFFLKFDASRKGNFSVPACDASWERIHATPLCSVFYHDQEQTPEVNGTVDGGDCTRKGGCDCGGVPCGEYLFDHRNGTMLRNWLVDEYVLGPNGVGNANISGLFMDDYWCFNDDPATPTCHDPVQGASEINADQQRDMGLSDADIKQLALAWRATTNAVQRALLKHRAYAWDMLPNQHDAGCGAGPTVTKTNCKALLKAQCKAGAGTLRDGPLYSGFNVDKTHLQQSAALRLPTLMEDVAGFLLVRGDFAWLGYGFLGCAADVNYTQPEVMRQNFGKATAPCVEKASEDGHAVYTREYSGATVELDCDSWVGKVTTKEGRVF